MGTVILDVTMSLDGFVAGPADGAEPPGGGFAHAPAGDLSARPPFDLAGAGGWDGWDASPSLPVPYLILSSEVPEESAVGERAFHAVTDGVAEIIEKAREAAGEGTVYVTGGAAAAQQCLRSGLLDGLRVHLVHVLLGEGIRLFDGIGPGPVELERTGVTVAAASTLLEFRVLS
jgi:dihydrofolate reductase